MSDLFPANPMTIELTITHRRHWWQGDEVSEDPEDWHVSADIWALSTEDPEDRHVGDLAVTLVPLGQEPNATDIVVIGEWAMTFLDEAYHAPGGTLPPDLAQEVPAGPERVVVIRRFEIVPKWRGMSAGTVLLASALSAFAGSARLAIAQVSVNELAEEYGDFEMADVMAERWGALLGRVGFRERNGLHVIDLRSPALMTARRSLTDRSREEGDEPEE